MTLSRRALDKTSTYPGHNIDISDDFWIATTDLIMLVVSGFSSCYHTRKQFPTEWISEMMKKSTRRRLRIYLNMYLNPKEGVENEKYCILS